jgi:molybdopterin-binding protein
MIAVHELSVRADNFELRDISFTLPRGTWGIVLGSAGAGKTTLLESIAGVRRAVAGRIELRGIDVTRQAPEHRGVGIVYQQSFLFPHLTVPENVAYGATDPVYVTELARRLGADQLSTRRVSALSGGERQIVALARALAPRPDVLLLDEPFAALDSRSRTRVRRELRAIQRELSLTVLQVTHDFAEAGTLGDLAILLDAGRLVQAASPETLFRRPPTAAAAEFLGAENVYAGIATPLVAGSDDELGTMSFRTGNLTLIGVGEASSSSHAVIRGEDVVLSRDRPGPSSARNVLEGVITEVAAYGALARVTLAIADQPLVATLTAGSVAELGLVTGGRAVASVKATAVHLC